MPATTEVIEDPLPPEIASIVIAPLASVVKETLLPATRLALMTELAIAIPLPEVKLLAFANSVEKLVFVFVNAI